MTQPNQSELDEILDKFGWACVANGDDGYGLQNEDVSEAKQAIISLIKELVAEAKPPHVYGTTVGSGQFNRGVSEFEQIKYYENHTED